MTLGAAWIAEGGVGLVTDSAVTVNSVQSPPLSGGTSTGQGMQQFSDRWVKEGALKLFSSHDLAFVAAGKLSGISDFARFLRDLGSEPSPTKRCRIAAERVVAERAFRALLAIREHGVPRLYYLDSASSDGPVETNGPIVIGSLPAVQSEAMATSLEVAATLHPRTESVLAVLAKCFSASFRFGGDMLEAGIGGTLFAGMMTKDGWQPAASTLVLGVSPQVYESLDDVGPDGQRLPIPGAHMLFSLLLENRGACLSTFKPGGVPPDRRGGGQALNTYFRNAWSPGPVQQPKIPDDVFSLRRNPSAVIISDVLSDRTVAITNCDRSFSEARVIEQGSVLAPWFAPGLGDQIFSRLRSPDFKGTYIINQVPPFASADS